jgi:hypothetical protein
MGLPVAERLAEARRRGADQTRACILVLLNGGASPWETFDPKPDAPREIRGPLRAISTAVPGVQFCESLPELSRRADRVTVVRSLFHTAAPTHEPGFQLLQVGELARRGELAPSLGLRAATELPSTWGVPGFVLLGGGLRATGTSARLGDVAASVSRLPGPLVVDSSGRVVSEAAVAESLTVEIMTDLESETRNDRDRYGDSEMGRLLMQSRQLVEQGVRFVTVNTFNRLEGARTWDAHGCPTSAPATVFDYHSWLGPQFDRALSALLDDLTDRGLLESTLVVCAGEIGRSPLLNAGGGREHWTTGFSGVLIGGDSQPGAVLGATSRHGGEITAAPYPLERLAGVMQDFLGLAPKTPPAVPVEAELARITLST